MNDLRARPTDLCMSDAMPFQQSWQYRTTHPVADVLHADFFRPVHSMLRAGDSVTICRFDSVGGKRLIEFVNVRVVASASDGVPLVKAGEIITVPKQDTKTATVEMRTYAVKKQFGGGFLVEDDKGNAIDQFKTKQEAEEYAARMKAA